ncbi:MAG: penicillin-binding transpeptidase domain-containing protein [Candidatus Parcubacteria bacterium]|nr:penicillin-binding transpeptidase domain-containing protein [Candidatus Parcubacteria bacterium]
MKDKEIYPDEIFIDSENIPKFDTQQFEGRLEKPISKQTFWFLSVFLGLLLLFLFTKIFYLQVVQGKILTERGEKNSLRQEIVLPPRAIISDRRGIKLAWDEGESRNYIDLSGFSHILGYTGLPSKEDLEAREALLMNEKIGKDGIEKKYESVLQGTAGVKLVEIDSQNNITSESIQSLPQGKENFNLTIDSRVQSRFFQIMASALKGYNFQGGAGIILDANTGEILSLVSWPEYNPKNLESFLKDKSKPFLNRAIAGLYAPGSIIKPLIALGALNEGTISPEKQIFSSGSISIPNPFFPDKKSVFRDWKAHGWVDMRKALAVSSDVYFYEVGGGFEDVKGLGITKIEDYAKKFGFTSKTGIDLNNEEEGTVPSPELKAKVNPGDPIWRVGDTYNASIGQGYFHITPAEMAVYASILANNGKIIKPCLVSCSISEVAQNVGIPEEYFSIVKEGMRMAVTGGTASGLNVFNVALAAKTGTAEIDPAKKYINSWVIGFFPYENPKYAFAVVAEKGPYNSSNAALYTMRQLIDWMSIYTPEYLK